MESDESCPDSYEANIIIIKKGKDIIVIKQKNKNYMPMFLMKLDLKNTQILVKQIHINVKKYHSP